MKLADYRRLVVVLGLMAMINMAGTSPATAQTGRGFVISPAFQQVAVRADQPSAAYILSLRNTTSQDQNFRLSVVDFGSLDEEGGVAFLGQPATELEHRYGLASWMTLEREAVFVPALGQVQIKVTIENKQSLGSGGHYAAVLATAVTDTGQPAADPRVGIKQVLSSLVLATKEGGEVAALNLASQSHDGGWWRLPGTMNFRFQNAGNVHVVPRGRVAVKDSVGRVVKQGALNEASAVILPESFRRYKTSLMSVGNAWMPGIYRIETSYRYDGNEKTKTLVNSFWFVGQLIGWLLIVGILSVVGGGIWLWRRGFRPRLRWPRGWARKWRKRIRRSKA